MNGWGTKRVAMHQNYFCCCCCFASIVGTFFTCRTPMQTDWVEKLRIGLFFVCFLFVVACLFDCCQEELQESRVSDLQAIK